MAKTEKQRDCTCKKQPDRENSDCKKNPECQKTPARRNLPARQAAPDRINPEKIPVRNLSMSAPQTDPDGSWTGVPQIPTEKPVQDADDL